MASIQVSNALELTVAVDLALVVGQKDPSRGEGGLDELLAGPKLLAGPTRFARPYAPEPNREGGTNL